MFTDIKQYIKLMSRYQITEHQMLILYLLDSNNIEAINMYKESIGKFNTKEYEDLIDRNIITELGDLKIIDFDFDDNNEDEHLTMFNEVWNIYPNKLSIDGKLISAKSCNFVQLAKFYYDNCINKSNKQHKEMLTKLKDYFTGMNFALMGIKKFFESKEYERLENINGRISKNRFK